MSTTILSHLARVAEPEKMTEEEESHYARADYSVPHEAFADDIVAAIGRDREVSLADLGTGPGDVPIRLRSKVDWNLWGVDLSAGMLGIAVEDAASRLAPSARPINWVIADIKRTGLPAQQFDAVISNSVLHHLEDALKFWREVARIGKPGSFVHVRDLRRPESEADADRLTALHVGEESPVVQEHYRSSLLSAYRPEEVEQQLADAGLHGLQVRPLDDRYLEVVGWRRDSA
ncbi:MAG: methyltransferase domain-containing protein [Rhizobacter sp.]